MNAIGADSNDFEKHFKLMADIDLAGFTGTSFNMIGTYYPWHPFTGVFDGSGHTISNFTYASTGTNYIGLFGCINDPNAEIKDLGLIDPNIDAGTGEYVGSLVSCLSDGTITNCYVEGGSVLGNHPVGGLVGLNLGTITNCYSEGSVSGNSYVGGLVGWNDGTITNCYSIGDVEGEDDVGGLVGGNGGTITNSYASGGVLANEEVGGLVGKNGWYVPALVFYFGTISNCYSTGSVIGTTAVGGLVGYNEYGEVMASFWDTETSGQPTSDGGMGLPTAEMQNPNTFIDAGWDFVGQPDGPSDIWAEPAGGGYPVLWWELSPLAPLPTFSGGSGTADDPYLISTPNDLNGIGHNPRLMGARFKLIGDIDLIRVGVYIIGSQLFPFTGEIHGNSHRISNFTYSSTGTDYVGLFGYVDDANAVIKDLGLIDPDVDAGTGGIVGSLVGYVKDGTITGCYVEGGSVSGRNRVGGLVGVVEENYYGTITNCYSSAAVSGDAYVGGLVGRNYDGAISNCYSTGSVTGTGGVSGLVGGNDGGTITNCYSSGNITGDDFVGGLVGFNRGTITNCYSFCSISGAAYVGGVVGENNIGNVSYCYFEGIVSGTGSYSGGIAGINRSGAAISNCYSSGSVYGYGQVGGLAGGNFRGIISDGILINCYSTSTVEGDRSVGGLVGLNKAVVLNSYSTGNVSGVESVGGLVGKNSYSTSGYGEISNCYSGGSVSGTTDVGGLVGLNDSGTVSNAFWDIETSGQTTSDGGIGKTTGGMQMASTFADAGWDFVDVWEVCEGMNYPILVWQIPVGDFICPDGVNMSDFSFFARYWLRQNCNSRNAFCMGIDLNRSGTVDVVDLGIFLENWLASVE